GFVRKSKSVGLTLQQMKRVLDVARSGRSPCPEVEQWVMVRLADLRKQIRALQKVERRLKILSSNFVNRGNAADRSRGLCSLIMGLPEEKRFRERNGCTRTCRPDTESEATDAC